MRIVTSWLNEHLSKELSVVEITTALDKAGIEVENETRPPVLDPLIVAATVTAIKPHPDADNLSLVTVKYGDKKTEVVCGAKNLVKNMRVALARTTAKLPDGTVISKAKIRGIYSDGMLCSEKELGLGTDHSGILDLGPEVTEGTALQELYSFESAVIDAATASNRWDLQSYRGVALEVAAHTNVELNWDKIADTEINGKKTDGIFSNHAKDTVPCYALIQLQLPAAGKVVESPGWMQEYLRLQGIRPVNAVVDVTNYVMFETGQPLHAFDAKKIDGKLQVRFANSQEKITTLDGVVRSLSSEDLVIADDSGPQALAGVMGGKDSEVSTSTSHVYLEAATFDGLHVRKTAQRHGIRTEASARFEREIPVIAVRQALKYAVFLLKEVAGATEDTYQNELNIWPWVRHVGVRMGKTNSLLGMDLSKQQAVDHLKKLHFDAEEFNIANEARKHLGKPYKLGARFKTDQTDAFDCSYLVDYLYSLIGANVGHTALGQYELGKPVEGSELKAGDVVFIEGKIDKSATDHYYVSDTEGNKVRYDLETDKRVGHNGLYVGDGKVVMAAEYRYEDGAWVKRDNAGVVEVDLEELTENPGYMGARRYIDDLDNYIRATLPWWRPDIQNEADIAEELIKLEGLDKLPSTIPSWSPEAFLPDKYWAKIDSLRQVLRGLGLVEVTTYPFISEKDIETFKMQDWQFLKLQNPRSLEQAFLRRSLVSQLSMSVVNNSTYKDIFGLFEIAKVFIPRPDFDLPEEVTCLGIITQHPDSTLKVKRYVDEVMSLLNIKADFQLPGKRDYLHPARQTAIGLEPGLVGHYGDLHPDITHKLKLKAPVSFAELDVDLLLQSESLVKFRPLPLYQSSHRDLTILLPGSVTWQQLEKVIAGAENTRCWFKDEFARDGKKAVTVHLELEAFETTLTDKDIKNRLTKLEQVIKDTLGAEIDS